MTLKYFKLFFRHFYALRFGLETKVDFKKLHFTHLSRLTVRRTWPPFLPYAEAKRSIPSSNSVISPKTQILNRFSMLPFRILITTSSADFVHSLFSVSSSVRPITYWEFVFEFLFSLQFLIIFSLHKHKSGNQHPQNAQVTLKIRRKNQRIFHGLLLVEECLVSRTFLFAYMCGFVVRTRCRLTIHAQSVSVKRVENVYEAVVIGCYHGAYSNIRVAALKIRYQNIARHSNESARCSHAVVYSIIASVHNCVHIVLSWNVTGMRESEENQQKIPQTFHWTHASAMCIISKCRTPRVLMSCRSLGSARKGAWYKQRKYLDWTKCVFFQASVIFRIVSPATGPHSSAFIAPKCTCHLFRRSNATKC